MCIRDRVNAGGKLTAKMPAGKNYMSVAILPDGSDNAFELYKKYAFNFITDTKVEWKYLSNSSKVVTKYNAVSYTHLNTIDFFLISAFVYHY